MFYNSQHELCFAYFSQRCFLLCTYTVVLELVDKCSREENSFWINPYYYWLEKRPNRYWTKFLLVIDVYNFIKFVNRKI